MGRPKGIPDARPRSKWNRLQPLTRGSESSRILQRRLSVQAAGGGMSLGEERTLTAHALAEFERQQVARVKRVLAQSESRINEARRQVQRDNERATRHEVVWSFEVEVRGSCGSDIHLGGDS